MRTTVGRLAVVGVAATAALAFGMAPQASALETCVSTSGARVCFESLGDHFYVYDTVSDGHRAGVAFYYGTSGWYYCDNTGGNGSVKDCNYDLPESATVYFRAEVCDRPCSSAGGESGNLIRYSGWQDASVPGCSGP